MAVLLRFLEPLIYPPPWSIINANSTENDVLSPSFLPCNEKIPHCNFFSKRHKLSLLRPHNKFSNFSFLNLSRLSSILFLSCGIQIFSSLKRKEETIEGNKGGKENKGRAMDKGIYTRKRFFFLPPLFFSSPSFGCFSIDNRRTGQRGNAVRFSDS